MAGCLLQIRKAFDFYPSPYHRQRYLLTGRSDSTDRQVFPPWAHIRRKHDKTRTPVEPGARGRDPGAGPEHRARPAPETAVRGSGIEFHTAQPDTGRLHRRRARWRNRRGDRMGRRTGTHGVHPGTAGRVPGEDELHDANQGEEGGAGRGGEPQARDPAAPPGGTRPLRPGVQPPDHPGSDQGDGGQAQGDDGGGRGRRGRRSDPRARRGSDGAVGQQVWRRRTMGKGGRRPRPGRTLPLLGRMERSARTHETRMGGGWAPATHRARAAGNDRKTSRTHADRGAGGDWQVPADPQGPGRAGKRKARGHVRERGVDKRGDAEGRGAKTGTRGTPGHGRHRRMQGRNPRASDRGGSSRRQPALADHHR